MRSLLVLPIALLAACGSNGAAPTPSGTPVPTLAVPTGSVPSPEEGSAVYPAIAIGDVPGELLRASNADDAGRTSTTLVVSLPAGQRLGTRAACEGVSTMTVTTSPATGAASTFTCDPTRPQELVATATSAVTTGTTYAVTVSVPAPARWALVVYGATG